MRTAPTSRSEPPRRAPRTPTRRDELSKARAALAEAQGLARLANERLEEERNLSAALISKLPGLFVMFDEHGRLARWNEHFSALTGRSDEELLGADPFAVIVDRDRATARTNYQQAIEQGSAQNEFDIVDHSGAVRSVLWNGASIMRAGRPIFLAIGLDITEASETETRLRASEERFRTIFDRVNDGILVHDPVRGGFIDANRRFCEMLGYSREEILNLGLADISAGSGADSRRRAAVLLKQARAGNTAVFEWLLKAKDGEEIWTEVSLGRAQFGGRQVLLSTVRDIAERRQAEFARAQLANIVESSSDAIVGKTLSGEITSWNAGAEQIYGYRAEEVVGRNILLVVPDERRQELQDALSTLARGERVERFDTERVRKDGARIAVSIAISPVRNATGRVVGASTITRDISEQKRAADALADRSRLLHAVAIGTNALIRADTLDEGMTEALRIVGEALRADRVLVIQEHPDQSPPVALRYAWQGPGVEAPLDASTFAALPYDAEMMAAWREPLLHGKPVISQLATSQGAVRAMLEQTKNKSTLVMPIFVHGSLWGSFGIDSCAVARDWTAGETDALEVFADTTGSILAHAETVLALEQSEERFRVLATTAQDAIVMGDAAGRIRYWNAAAERMLGYSAEEASTRQIRDFLPKRFRRKAARGMKALASTARGEALSKTVELAAIRKDGVEIAIEMSLAGVSIAGGWQAIAIIRDITDRKKAERQIARMARSDALTGLPNRRAFVDGLRQAIAAARRGGKSFAVLYLDLDHFKDINDTLGHPIGDRLLHAVAQRLRESIRESDTLARFGGDEFAVIAKDIVDPADAAALAETLLASVREPFSIQGNDIRSGTSVGIAVHGPDSPNAESLLSHADIALYRAKSAGRGGYRFFTDEMDEEVHARVALGAELRTAIDTGQLSLLYQPQIDIETNRVLGVEALVRWNHPRRGPIGPDKFIPAAERMGLIVALGHWVLREACRQTRAWLDAGCDPGIVAVNLSSLQFKAPIALERDIAAILKEAGLEANRIELELTETVLMDTSREHNDVLQRLRQSGLRLAIDDFGTGYSSLDYLRRFPVDRIKIAQIFMVDLATVPSNATIVKATIALALALNIDVIAEGVETAEQLDMLRTWGCRQAQGFYFSRPLTPTATAEFLARSAAPRSSTAPEPG
jgi:diguanylate cyclase (GGDEF)-like protein/PAS domain S-box-containing protein